MNSKRTPWINGAALVAAFSGLVVACGEDGVPTSSKSLFDISSSSLTSREEAEDLAVRLLGGRILASERRQERGREVFEIEVLRLSGSVVEIDVEAASGRVLEVESESPVEGDDLDVGSGLLTLREAIDIARRTVTGTTTLVAWEIELDDDARDPDWEWEIVLRSASGETTEVEIDARSGDFETDDDSSDEPWDDDDFDDDDVPVGQVPADVAAAALALVPGTIEQAERETEDGYLEWEVVVRTASGARVTIEISATSGRLIEAYGESGPFDYPFEPAGYLTLSEALAAAALSATDIQGWEFDRDEDRVTYEFESVNQRWVEIDAATGALVDDDDDDDDDRWDDDDDD